MKSFLSKNKKLLAISLIGFFIFSSGVAFAYTSQDWLTKATSWANTNCVNPTAATKQKAFFCYLWSKSDEQQTAINNLNTANNTKTTQISDLQGKAKNIWVYDKNNNKLGIFADGPYQDTTIGAYIYRVYEPTINRFVIVKPDGATGQSAAIGYTASNCSGQAYVYTDRENGFGNASSSLLKDIKEAYYITTDPSPNIVLDLAYYSKQNDGDPCVLVGRGYYGMLVSQITPSFPSRVTFPLIFKYE